MAKEHVGLKVLGVLDILAGLLILLIGVGYLALGWALNGVGEPELIPILLPIAVASSIIGAVSIVIGLILIFVGYNLFKERKWAYWLTFVIFALGFIVALFTFNLLGLLVDGIILIYLWSIRKDFSEGVDWGFVRGD